LIHETNLLTSSLARADFDLPLLLFVFQCAIPKSPCHHFGKPTAKPITNPARISSAVADPESL